MATYEFAVLDARQERSLRQSSVAVCTPEPNSLFGAPRGMRAYMQPSNGGCNQDFGRLAVRIRPCQVLDLRGQVAGMVCF